jgi:altronate hydrolase
VNCSATVARHIAKAAGKTGLLDGYQNVDGVVAIRHTSGCGMAGEGEGFELLRRTLWGTAASPNFGAVLLVGLGCEVLQINRMKAEYRIDGSELTSFTIQEIGARVARSPRDSTACERCCRRLTRRSGRRCRRANLCSRCNAAARMLGRASPRIPRSATRPIASSIWAAPSSCRKRRRSTAPSIFLYARARSPEISAKLRARVDWWENYTKINGGKMNNNPSPGNKVGGLSTILEKSLGAVAKAGTSPLNDVIEYAQPVTERGLVFMDRPGFDPCSVTAQVASGANVVAFTTGRGSAFGYKPSPSIKLSSNSETYAGMKDDIDIDCGTIATGETRHRTKG